jgi:hypothetical protein
MLVIQEFNEPTLYILRRPDSRKNRFDGHELPAATFRRYAASPPRCRIGAHSGTCLLNENEMEGVEKASAQWESFRARSSVGRATDF